VKANLKGNSDYSVISCAAHKVLRPTLLEGEKMGRVSSCQKLLVLVGLSIADWRSRYAKVLSSLWIMWLWCWIQCHSQMVGCI